MYQIPKWRYWLVIVVMAVGLVFALPNVFGEDPALQVGRQNRQAMDEPAASRVRALLEQQSIPVRNSKFVGDRLVLTFADVDTQLKARDALVETTAGEFSTALSTASAAPDFLLAVGLKPMGLGLDLRGGIHFMYQVDVDSAIEQAFDRLERDARATLRDKRIPYSAIARDASGLKVTLRAAENSDAAVEALSKMDDGLLVTANDSTQTPEVAIALSADTVKLRQTEALQQNITTLRNRVDELGVAEPIVQRQGKDRIVVQLPGMQDPIEAKRILGSTATLQWHMVDETNDPYEADRTKRVPVGSRLYKMRDDGRPILLRRELIVSAENMADARTSFDQGRPAVSVKLDARGGDAMLRNTQQNVGRRMAVLFIEKKELAPGERCDGVRVANFCTEEKVISDATIRGVFGPQFQIDGLSAGEARDLSLLLRAGSLATPMFLVEQRVVGPTLGKDNIAKGMKALGAGLLITFVFMVIYYKAFGFVANAVLLANIILLAALLSFLPTSLTLPGIAGLVLTVGMAVDANILIYERIREELRLGNSPQASINAGYDRAFSAILDANVTTLIAGIVLFAIGSGPVRGFAVVLSLGILTSMFTAIIGSRVLVHLVWGRRPRLERLPI
jgi:preprotein translocase subunit SecD